MKIIKKIYHYLIPFISDIFYGFPGKKMIIIGVTGTKGKSTTSRLIASVLEAGGYKVGLMSTVEFQVGDKRNLNTKKMTMLGRGEIQKMLKKMVLAGCRYAVIETSSEGILQNRHLGVHYDIAVFTNLGLEHSERHGGFENLKKDKGRLFSQLSLEKNKLISGLKIQKVIVVNTDDDYSDYFLNFTADKKIGYGMSKKEGLDMVVSKEVEIKDEFLSFKVNNSSFKLFLLGKFNIYNALAAIAVGRSQEISLDKIQKGIESVKKVEGRMEFIDEGQDFKVVVDYAHEPLSLTELFSSLKGMIDEKNKIIAVVGSDGGGRDKLKREKMGEISGDFCDIVIITDVNSFDEDPKEIAEMLAKGARNAGKKEGQNLFVEIDRGKAVEKAFSLAKTGDIVAITAKGTEPCIVIKNNKKIPWDDRKISRLLLKKLK